MKKKHHLHNLPQGKREVMMAAINAITSVDHDTLLPGGGGVWVWVTAKSWGELWIGKDGLSAIQQVLPFFSEREIEKLGDWLTKKQQIFCFVPKASYFSLFSCTPYWWPIRANQS
jgi:hypothetical protein